MATRTANLSKPKIRPRSKGLRRGASMDADVSGMLREWNRDPIPQYPGSELPVVLELGLGRGGGPRADGQPPPPRGFHGRASLLQL